MKWHDCSHCHVIIVIFLDCCCCCDNFIFIIRNFYVLSVDSIVSNPFYWFAPSFASFRLFIILLILLVRDFLLSYRSRRIIEFRSIKRYTFGINPWMAIWFFSLFPAMEIRVIYENRIHIRNILNYSRFHWRAEPEKWMPFRSDFTSIQFYWNMPHDADTVGRKGKKNSVHMYAYCVARNDKW